jgi:hypothetical protein
MDYKFVYNSSKLPWNLSRIFPCNLLINFFKNLTRKYGNYQKNVLKVTYDVRGKSHTIDCMSHRGWVVISLYKIIVIMCFLLFVQNGNNQLHIMFNKSPKLKIVNVWK